MIITQKKKNNVFGPGSYHPKPWIRPSSIQILKKTYTKHLNIFRNPIRLFIPIYYPDRTLLWNGIKIQPKRQDLINISCKFHLTRIWYSKISSTFCYGYLYEFFFSPKILILSKNLLITPTGNNFWIPWNFFLDFWISWDPLKYFFLKP